jgi:antitoxin ParD1/3/4
MARTTSFTLGEELEGFVREQIESGAHSSASEVMREALTFYAEEKRKEVALLEALDKGVASGIAPPGTFDRIRKRFGWPK